MGIEKVIRDADVAYYYPRTVSPSKEFKTLAAIENPEYQAVWELVWKWFCNTFVYDLDADGATRWEEMLSLPIRHTADLEDRRAAILAKINHMLPYTERSFQRMLNDNYGEGMVEAQCDYDKYELALIFSEAGFAYIKKALMFTRIIVPANLDLITRLIASLVYKAKHSSDAVLNVSTEQGFWLDTTYINQYWKGYHVSDGSGQQLTGYWRLAGNTRLNGLFNRHLHEWLGETRFDGKEWQDIRGNNQKHKAEIIKTIAAEQLGRKAGYRLNSTWQLNNWLQLDWPRSYVQEHDIQIDKVLDGTQLEQHKHGANATGIVEARQIGSSAGYKLNGKYRLNNVLRLQWPRRSMHRHNVEIGKIVAAEQSGNKTGYRLNSTHQLNSTLRLEWPKRSMQQHSADSISIVEAGQTGKGTGYRLNGTHQLNNTLRLQWPKRTTQKHSADSISIVTAEQVGGSAGYKLNGKYRLNNTLRLQWPRRSMQKHSVDSIGIVTAEQVGKGTGYRLNGTHQLNSTLRLEWPKRTTQKHSADSTNIVEARQIGSSAGYKLNGKYRLNNILRLEWPKRSMQKHSAGSTNIVEASQTGKGTGYRLNSTHQLNNTLRLEWPRRSMQIHQAEISKIVVAEQSGNKTGYRLNSTHRLNNTLRLQWPRHSICAHSAIITIVRGNTKTVEVV